MGGGDRFFMNVTAFLAWALALCGKFVFRLNPIENRPGKGPALDGSVLPLLLIDFLQTFL